MWQDLHYAARTLRKNPAFSLAAILALALGIGATTAIFSVVDIVMLRPLPYPEAGRLISVTTYLPSLNFDFVVSPEYVEWNKTNRVFENFSAIGHNFSPAPLLLHDGPIQIRAARVTTNFLATLRVAPVLGRTFLPEEARPDGATPIILSYGLWETRFGSDPGVLAKAANFDGISRQIVGVLPKDFYFPSSIRVDALIPLKIDETPDARKSMSTWDTVGRLKPGVSLQQARANFETLFAATSAAHPEVYRKDVELRLMRFQDRLTGNVRTTLLILLAGVGCVLLIACANVANLLLARAAVRQKEIAVRAALGAGRMRLIRQLLTESLLLAVIGGSLGIVLAEGTVRVLHRVAPEDLPRIAELSVDLRVLVFALLISLATGVLFGLAPSMTATRPPARFARSGPRSFLVAAELALSLTLLVAAGLLFQSLWRMQHKRIGFEPENILMAKVPLQGSRFQELQDRMQSIPGMQSVAFSDSMPPGGGSGLATFSREGRPLPQPWHRGDPLMIRKVSPGYFETLRIPLKRGRVFTNSDGKNVAIVNETVARLYFPGEDPIGKQIELRDPKIIVGIVADVKNRGLDHEPISEMYNPLPFNGNNGGVNVILRTIGDPAMAATALRQELYRMDLQMLATVQTMQHEFDELTVRPRFNGILFASFAVVALLLAVVGVYGVISFTVARRAQEIGIRMALGADAARVRRLVLKDALIPTLAGIATGIFGAMAAGRYLGTLLYDVRPTDPATYVAVSLILAIVAMSASLIPARRAARLDPMRVLRAE